SRGEIVDRGSGRRRIVVRVEQAPSVPTVHLLIERGHGDAVLGIVHDKVEVVCGDVLRVEIAVAEHTGLIVASFGVDSRTGTAGFVAKCSDWIYPARGRLAVLRIWMLGVIVGEPRRGRRV